MKLPHYSVGICFYNREKEKDDIFRKECWSLLSDCLHMEQLKDAILYGVVPTQKDELLETDYICVFTNIKRKKAGSVARTVLHNPQLCSRLSFYYPIVQHNRLIRMDAQDELGSIDENGECADLVFLPGKPVELDDGYCLAVALEEEDPEERIRKEMVHTETDEYWKPFPIRSNLVDASMAHNAGARVMHFDTGKKKGCIAYVLPDETCLLNVNETDVKSQKDALSKLGYEKVLTTADFDMEKLLEIGRFDVLARRAEKVMILRPKEENSLFFKICERAKAACKNVELR